MTIPSSENCREFIEVLNWESFQYSGSHRKPDPPWKWFRIHGSFIRSPMWRRMTKPQQADFVTLLFLASEYGNMIEKDNSFLRLHGISAKILPTLEELGLIRVFSLPFDHQKINDLKAIYSGGLPDDSRLEERRKEETREEESKEDAQERTSAPGLKESKTSAPVEQGRMSRDDFLKTSGSSRHDPRKFDELKMAVKPHIQKFGPDPEVIKRMAGQSLGMSLPQIAECVRQLVADGEVPPPH